MAKRRPGGGGKRGGRGKPGQSLVRMWWEKPVQGKRGERRKGKGSTGLERSLQTLQDPFFGQRMKGGEKKEGGRESQRGLWPVLSANSPTVRWLKKKGKGGGGERSERIRQHILFFVNTAGKENMGGPIKNLIFHPVLEEKGRGKDVRSFSVRQGEKRDR